jgi:Protein of unknown function (DUF3352)
MNARAAIADRRIRAALAGGVVVVVVVLIVLLATGGGSASPPADDAAKLVPATALVYVHVSTDAGRGATKTALKLAQRFPSFSRLRSALLRRLEDPRCGGDLGRQHGKEAALALLNSQTGTAGSLVLVDTGRDHPGAATKACGLVSQTYIGRFLVIGQPDSLTAARALARSGGKGSLARDPGFGHAMSALPADRVADAWASADGVRRLLAPQGGLLGAAGVLLDQPALKAAAMALVARDKSARVIVRSELDPGIKRMQAFKPFSPTLQKIVPKGVLGYLGISDLSSALSRVLAAAGPQTAGLGPLLRRAGQQLDRQSGGRLTRAVLATLQGEVAVTLTPALPAPVLTVIGHARPDTRSALAQLESPIAKLLGKGARFRTVTVAGAGARELKAGPVTLAYAVVRGNLVIATSPAGIAAVANAPVHLDSEDQFKTVAGDAPGKVSSLLFLDFTELLRLGEQTGLGGSSAYQSVRQDLQKVRAVGAWSSGSGDESTAEINLSIP